MPNDFDPAIGAATRWRKGQPSPNPGGRPKSRLLSTALGAKLAEVDINDSEGRTHAEVIASNIVSIASSRGPSAVAAVAEIANRLEGRSMQRLEVNDITADLANRTDDELRFHLLHDAWPEDQEAASVESENGSGN